MRLPLIQRSNTTNLSLRNSRCFSRMVQFLSSKKLIKLKRWGRNKKTQSNHSFSMAPPLSLTQTKIWIQRNWKRLRTSRNSTQAKTTSLTWISKESPLLRQLPSRKRSNLWRANLSLFKSIPLSFLNSEIKYSTTALSKSSPPKKVSPFVDLT